MSSIKLCKHCKHVTKNWLDMRACGKLTNYYGEPLYNCYYHRSIEVDIIRGETLCGKEGFWYEAKGWHSFWTKLKQMFKENK